MATITYPGKFFTDEGILGTAQNGSQYVEVRSSVSKGIKDGDAIIVDGVEFVVASRGKVFTVNRKDFVRLYATPAPAKVAVQRVDEEDMGDDVADVYVHIEG